MNILIKNVPDEQKRGRLRLIVSADGRDDSIAETGTRLPRSAPVFAHPEVPEALALTGVFFLVFLVGAVYQVWRLHSRSRPIALRHRHNCRGATHERTGI